MLGHHWQFCAGVLIALICGLTGVPEVFRCLAASRQHRDYHLHVLDGILHKERENSMIDVDRLTDDGVKG
jgi:hypothetical protein